MVRLGGKLETEIARKFLFNSDGTVRPFGLLLDIMWNDGAGHKHLAVFICYLIKNDDNKGELFLLCLTPLIDATTSDAMSKIRTISTALKGLALTLKHVSFIVADNTSVNSCIARKIKKHMIWCKSHVIALGMKEFLNGHRGKWFKVSNLVFKESYLDLIDRVSAYTSP